MTRRATLTLAALLVAFPLAAQTQQGIALFEQGHLDEARHAFAAAPADAQTLTYLGRIAMAQNDLDGAIDYFEKAVAKHPHSAEAHYWLGNAYGNAALRANLFKQPGFARKAKRELERAVALDGSYLDARFALIEYYTLAPSLLGGSVDKALKQATEIRKHDKLLGHRAFASIFVRERKLDLARKEFVEAVHEYPSSAMAHTWLGAFYGLNDKNIKAGFEELELAMKIDPAYMPACFRYGQLAARSGANLGHAEEPLKKYLSHRPKENEPDLASAWYFLGLVYEKQGKRADALQSYSTAAKMNPRAGEFREAVKRMKG